MGDVGFDGFLTTSNEDFAETLSWKPFRGSIIRALAFFSECAHGAISRRKSRRKFFSISVHSQQEFLQVDCRVNNAQHYDTLMVGPRPSHHWLSHEYILQSTECGAGVFVERGVSY